MNTPVILALAALVALPALHAKDKPSARSGSSMPSAVIDPIMTKALDAIEKPLESDVKLPKIEVGKLRATFAGDEIKATSDKQKQMYQNAMSICDALTKGMDDRAAARAAAAASATMPTANAGSIVKSTPMRGRDAGAATEAARKMEKDRRKYDDKASGQKSAFLQSGAYRAWVDRSTQTRKAVMALYTRQIQMESAIGSEIPKATPATAESKPAEPAKRAEKRSAKTATDTASDRLIIGKWMGTENEGLRHEMFPDGTLTRTGKQDKSSRGTWKWKDRSARIAIMNWGATEWELTIAADGKTLQAHNLTDRRSKNDDSTWKRTD